MAQVLRVKVIGFVIYGILEGMDVDKEHCGDLYAVKSRSNQIIRFPYTETGWVLRKL